jgi:hypothetical protein
MSNALKKFILHIFILSAILVGAGYLLFNTVLSEFYFSLFPLVVLAFMIISILVHVNLVTTIHQKPQKFNSRFLLTLGLKLLAYLLILITYLLLSNDNQPLPFISTFIFCYFLYTIYNIRAIFIYLNNFENLKKM